MWRVLAQQIGHPILVHRDNDGKQRAQALSDMP